jgi:hypothetical protein
MISYNRQKNTKKAKNKSFNILTLPKFYITKICNFYIFPRFNLIEIAFIFFKQFFEVNHQLYFTKEATTDI